MKFNKLIALLLVMLIVGCTTACTATLDNIESENSLPEETVSQEQLTELPDIVSLDKKWQTILI